MTLSPRFDPRLVLMLALVGTLASAGTPTVEAARTTASSPVPTASAVPTVSPGSAASPGSTPTAGRVWRPPLAGEVTVTRPFVPPATPYSAGHRGVDLSALPGSPVLAAADGEVTFAGPVAGRGVVVVAHGAFRTTYEPVTTAVLAGEWVTAGQPIGVVEPGHLGCPTAGCLHWGLRHGEEYLDPLLLVVATRPRLLPLG